MSNAAAVLVLDTVPQTLAVVRSLGRAGYRVVLGRDWCRQRSHAEWSRHCQDVWLHPPFAEPAAFGAALAALLERRPEIHTIFPVSETSMEALRGNCRRRRVNVAMVREELRVACRDKVLGNDLAAQAGLRVPESHVVHDLGALHRAVEQIGFPTIIKSLNAMHRVYGRKAYVVPCRRELDAVFGEWPSTTPALLVQRYVAGPLASCDYLAVNGRLIGYCEARVLRTDMPDGSGFAVDFESIRPTGDLLEAATRFARTHGYTGPGLIQFIRCPDSGELYFLENNPRLAAGIAHTIDSGQDLPKLAVEVASGCHSSPTEDFQVGDYRYGYRAHWLMRDIQGLLARRRTIGLAGQGRWLLELVRSSLQADGHITWKWRDPMPTVLLYARFFRHHFAQLFSRAGAR